MKSNKLSIAVLVPCYNEALTIKTVISDFQKYLPEADIYVYDNNSTDGTDKIAEEAGAIVRYEHQQGKANVVRSMFREIDADIYIMVDGDDTYPASEVQKLVDPVLKQGADMVIGDRLSNGTYYKENKRNFHQLGNNMVRFFINKLFKSNLKDIMTGYRAFSKSFVKSYPVLCKGFEIETEMSIFSLNNNLHIQEIAINFQDRPEGSESKLNTFSDGGKVLLKIFNLFRHYKPFMFFSFVSLFFVLLGVVLGIPVIKEYIEFQYIYKVPTSILATGLELIAMLSFSIGLILDTIAINERKVFEYHFIRYSEK